MLLETFTARFSENSEIWDANRYCSQISCAEIARCDAKSGGSYKGSKVGTFHTFLHVKRTVFGISEIQGALLHSS